MAAYAVHTQHGLEHEVRVATFPTFDEALAHAQSITPDTDGSMVPNIEDDYVGHPDYERGVRWLGNLYAVILKETD